ncbi:MAG: 30S ribosomal protein S27ae [Candidatus Bathyarchaeia archaeon]
MNQERNEKKPPRRAAQLYEVDYARGTVKLKNRRCPRCSRVMAFHKAPRPRWACGGCNYTEYVRQ